MSPPERRTPRSSGPSFVAVLDSTPTGEEPDSSPVTAVFTSGTARCMKRRYASASARVPASAMDSQVCSIEREKRTMRPSRKMPVANGLISM